VPRHGTSSGDPNTIRDEAKTENGLPAGEGHTHTAVADSEPASAMDVREAGVG
jgi:hypothetical protein